MDRLFGAASAPGPRTGLLLAAALLIAGCGEGGSDVAPPAAPPASGSAAGPAAVPSEGETVAVIPADAPAIRPPADGGMDPRAVELVNRYADGADADPANAGVRRQVAMALQANGAVDAAARAWEQVIAMTPADASAWYHRARLRKDAGDLEAAVADLSRAIELAPDQPTPLARRGTWLIEAGRFEEAEADFRAAAEIDRDHRPAAEGMARVWIQQDRHALALQQILVPLRDRGQATPHVRFLIGQALRKLGRDEEAGFELEAGAGSDIEWAAHDPWVTETQQYWVGERADLTRARLLVDAGRGAEAVEVLAPLVTDPATDTAARILLANALRQTGDLPRATELLADGVQARPDEPLVVLALADARLADEDLPAAGRLAQRAIDANPGLAQAHETLALIRFAEKDWPAAERAARRAVELEPTRFAANLHLGLAIDRQPQRRREAFEQLQTTRRRHPDRWEPYYYLGAMLGSAGQTADAMRFAEQAARISPGNRVIEDLRQRLEAAAPPAAAPSAESAAPGDGAGR
jgi:tetratricopeptide (TPR) repeat protein